MDNDQPNYHEPVAPNRKVGTSASVRHKIRAVWQSLLTTTKHAVRLLISRGGSGPVELERRLIRSLHPQRWPNFKQLRHSYQVFGSKERRIVTICLAAALTSTVWLGVNLIAKHLVDIPVSGGSYTEGITGTLQYVNPIFATTSAADMD